MSHAAESFLTDMIPPRKRIALNGSIGQEMRRGMACGRASSAITQQEVGRTVDMNLSQNCGPESIRYKCRMIRLTDEQWERIRMHFPEEHIPDGRAS